MNWAKLLPNAEFTYNNSWSLSTKITPFKALYGYDLNLWINISPEDNVIKGEVLTAYDQIIRLTKLR